MGIRLKQNIYIALLEKLLIVLLLFFLTRIIFYLFNIPHFAGISPKGWLHIILGGFRFDIAAICILNMPFIFLQTIPFTFRNSLIYRRISKILFFVINSLALLVNCIDFIYFRFTMKRSTADFFNLFTMGEDMKNTLPQMIRDFWYVALIWILLIVIMVLLYNRAKYYDDKKLYNLKYYIRNTVLFIIVSILTVIGARGGLQLKPINIITASLYADANNIPLVLNTPFTIAKTFNKNALEKVKYFKDDKELIEYYNPIHETGSLKLDAGSQKPNIVIIIIESFSKEHIGALNNPKSTILNSQFPIPNSLTPFIDSLIHESLVFTNGFSNGRRSIEGIPSVIAGIPSLLNGSFITSPYAADKFYSLPYLLKQEGYSTSFYHGGTNGTMGFDNFCKAAGIEQYYGRYEYNNDKDFDGNWGIFDEPFLQYMANSLDKTAQPFMASVFTLSSHHPYTIPGKYKNRFNRGNEFQRTVSYTDYALKRFFQTASHMSWFDNTLFVITADHTSQIYSPDYNSRLGAYEIPIIYYKHNSNIKLRNSKLETQNSKLIGMDSSITQQIDIMPSILDYIHYDKPYFAFGNSIFKKNNLTTHDLRLTTNFDISYLNSSYQLITNDYVLEFDGKQFTAVYDRKADHLLKNNLLNKSTKLPSEKIQQMHYDENLLKAIIQTYNQRMIENKLTIN